MRAAGLKIFRYLLLVDLLFHFNIAKSQTKTDSIQHAQSSHREFKNQGEQEAYWAEELFKRDYKKQSYKRYKGRIGIHGNTYKYKNTVLMVFAKPELKLIFNKGILYPDVIFNFFNPDPALKGIKIVRRRDTSLKTHNFVSIKPLTDSLRISDIEEQTFLNKKPMQKRFKFWLFRKGFANPTACFMELTNENATTETSMASFIKGAKLTFFHEGWVII